MLSSANILNPFKGSLYGDRPEEAEYNFYPPLGEGVTKYES